MSRVARLALLALAALVVLLAINTIIVGNETKKAEATIEGGEILNLPAGEVQVLEEGDPAGIPIVLLHCYSCSLHWWDELAPILARDHRLIRIDLLGHGGSQKPSGGYAIEDQAALVASAMDRLGVQGAVVVGHSMGFAVAVALAERASQLVDRVVNIGMGPANADCELPFTARLSYVPVLGQAIRRVAPGFAVRDAYADAFAPGFDQQSGFPNPDQVLEDYDAMTYTSFVEAHDATDEYRSEAPLDQRLRGVPVPLLSIFGAEDTLCDPESSQEAYGALPGARMATVDEAGHSPNVEQPREAAALIRRFAAEAARAPGAGRGGGDGRKRGDRRGGDRDGGS